MQCNVVPMWTFGKLKPFTHKKLCLFLQDCGINYTQVQLLIRKPDIIYNLVILRPEEVPRILISVPVFMT